MLKSLAIRDFGIFGRYHQRFHWTREDGHQEKPRPEESSVSSSGE